VCALECCDSMHVVQPSIYINMNWALFFVTAKSALLSKPLGCSKKQLPILSSPSFAIGCLSNYKGPEVKNEAKFMETSLHGKS